MPAKAVAAAAVAAVAAGALLAGGAAEGGCVRLEGKAAAGDLVKGIAQHERGKRPSSEEAALQILQDVATPQGCLAASSVIFPEKFPLDADTGVTVEANFSQPGGNAGIVRVDLIASGYQRPISGDDQAALQLSDEMAYEAEEAALRGDSRRVRLKSRGQGKGRPGLQLLFDEGADASIKDFQALRGPRIVHTVAPDVSLARLTEDADGKGHVDAPFGGSRGKWTLEVDTPGPKCPEIQGWAITLCPRAEDATAGAAEPVTVDATAPVPLLPWFNPGTWINMPWFTTPSAGSAVPGPFPWVSRLFPAAQAEIATTVAAEQEAAAEVRAQATSGSWNEVDFVGPDFSTKVWLSPERERMFTAIPEWLSNYWRLVTNFNTANLLVQGSEKWRDTAKSAGQKYAQHIKDYAKSPVVNIAQDGEGGKEGA